MNRFVLKQVVSLDARASRLELRGLQEEAVVLREEVCRLVRDHLGASHPWRISRLLELAAGCRRSGKVEKAERLYLEAIRFLDEGEEGPGDDTEHHLARGLNALGVLYCETDRVVEAVPLLERALQLAVREPAQAAISSNLAGAHHALGRFEAAETHCRAALAIYLRAGDGMVLEQIHTHCDLAELLADAERAAESEEQARAGLSLLEAGGRGAPAPASGDAAMRLAGIFWRLNRLETATRLFERAAMLLESGQTLATCLDALSELRRIEESSLVDGEG